MKTCAVKKCLAAVLSAVMLTGTASVMSISTTGAETTGTIIYSNDFESGDVSAFTGRGGVESIQVSTQYAVSGSSCMYVTDREKNWNGPQFLLDDLLEVGVQYTVSANVRAAWYNNINLSMEYTDESGERHYTNLAAVNNQGDGWSEFDAIKFSIPEGVTKSYLYFECNDQSDLYIDDFTICTAPVYEIQQDIPSLKDVYANYFKIGAAATTDEIAPKSAKDLILKHCNSLTLGNELKPDAILDKNACLAMAASGDDTNPQVNIASARPLLNFCRDNGLSVRGHVLVWHSQTPDWFFRENYDENGAWVTKDVMLKRMENYIKNVFAAVISEYPTVDFYAWDVVNECWLDDGSYRNGGTQADNANNSGWVKVFGDNSFIESAFAYARKYAPEGCKLYYNDFNEYMPGKTQAIYDMAMDLKEKGLIDGIGLQSHLDVGFPTASAYKKALEKFVSTGLDVQITELDITTSDISEAGFEKQAQLYSDILDACVEYADSISAVVFWGTTDDKSWRSSRYPLLFNEDFTAKPAYYAIIDNMPDTPPVTSTVTEQTTEATTTTSTTEVPSVKNLIPGDVNEDGKVNGLDLALLRQAVLTNQAFVMPAAEDTNGDGNVNAADIVQLTRFLLGRDVELKSWLPAPTN